MWYFLMGMIGGAVGVFLLAGWWVRTHVVFEEDEEEKSETEEEKKDDGEGV